jgi:putative colanic acid biosynthesis acetyltransferase WcaF
MQNNSSQPVYQDLKHFSVPKNFRGKSAWVVQLWWIVQSTLFGWSPQFLYEWRNFLLRLFGAQIGKGVKIRSSARITYPWKLEIGNHSWVGDDTELYTLGTVKIGNNVAIAHRVYLCTGTHDYQAIAFDIKSYDVVIEDEVWIPNDVFVAPGVTIGRGTVVGVRSTVLHDLPAGKICYGSPAKPIKDRIMDS